VASFADALHALNDLKSEGVVEDYAVAGAMALVFWVDPVPTFDLDVLVFLPEAASPIVDLSPIYSWSAARGYEASAEHVRIAGVPVQFLPSHGALADEAIRSAALLDYEGVPVRVTRPEYLAALYLEASARTLKRRERAAALREAPGFDSPLFAELLRRFNLEP
jgi:hypothetical protein